MITREVQKRKKKEREKIVALVCSFSLLEQHLDFWSVVSTLFSNVFSFFFVFGFYRSPLTFDV